MVESESPAYFRIKFSDGFTVIGDPASQNHSRRLVAEQAPSTIATFTIKTNKEATSGIYVNIVPIHKNG